VVFYIYTKTIFDIHGKDVDSVQRQQLTSPEFSFDMMDLYMVADFLHIDELANVIMQKFMNAQCLFSSSAANVEESEIMVAGMISRCSNLHNTGLITHLAKAYVSGTGGLGCLCRWPTLYPRYN
jgi:hypothetical protein